MTQLRAAIRKLPRALDRHEPALASKVRSALRRDDDYAGWASRPVTGTTPRPERHWSTPEGDDGVFCIARGVARDRIISVVGPEARHGHKSRNRRFDGYKTHASVDPDSELIERGGGHAGQHG